jgi:hypothetical protein
MLKLSNLLIGLASFCYQDGQKRTAFLESTKSDIHFAPDLGISLRSIYFGAISQAINEFFRNPRLGRVSLFIYLIATILISAFLAESFESLFFWGTLFWLCFNFGLHFYFHLIRDIKFSWLYLLSVVSIAGSLLIQDREVVSSCDDCGSVLIDGVFYFGNTVESQPQLALLALGLGLISLTIFVYSITEFLFRKNFAKALLLSIVITFHTYFILTNLASLGYWRGLGLQDLLKPLANIFPLQPLKIFIHLLGLMVLVFLTLRFTATTKKQKLKLPSQIQK